MSTIPMTIDEIMALLAEGPRSDKRIRQALMLARAQGELARIDKELEAAQATLISMETEHVS